MEKESAVRLELENRIMTHMQQKLTHNKAAKYSQQLTSKIATLKKEKVKNGFKETEEASRMPWQQRPSILKGNCVVIISILYYLLYHIFLGLQFQTGMS